MASQSTIALKESSSSWHTEERKEDWKKGDWKKNDWKKDAWKHEKDWKKEDWKDENKDDWEDEKRYGWKKDNRKDEKKCDWKKDDWIQWKDERKGDLTLKVATYNIQYDAGKGKHGQTRLDQIGSNIAESMKQDHSFILMQEMSMDNERVSKHAGPTYAGHVGNYTYLPYMGPCGKGKAAMFYNHTKWTLEATSCEQWMKFNDRPVQMATFNHIQTHDRILVINSHAPHESDMSTHDMQAELRDKLDPRKVLNLGLKNLQAIVFAGDFNREATTKKPGAMQLTNMTILEHSMIVAPTCRRSYVGKDAPWEEKWPGPHWDPDHILYWYSDKRFRKDGHIQQKPFLDDMTLWASDHLQTRAVLEFKA